MLQSAQLSTWPCPVSAPRQLLRPLSAHQLFQDPQQVEGVLVLPRVEPPVPLSLLHLEGKARRVTADSIYKLRICTRIFGEFLRLQYGTAANTPMLE